LKEGKEGKEGKQVTSYLPNLQPSTFKPHSFILKYQWDNLYESLLASLKSSA
jgi:hypothetical protein